MQLKDVIEIITTLIAVASAGASYYFAIVARKEAKLGQKMQLFSLRQQYYSELQEWANRAVAVITEAIYLDPNDSPETIKTKSLKVQQDISSLIDQGRFFFPNEKPPYKYDELEQFKPSAYRGYRAPALTNLVQVYRILDSYIKGSQVPMHRLEDQQLWILRKEFVSDLQDILSPRERNDQISTWLSSIS